MAYQPETKCVARSTKRKQLDPTGSISVPIYQTATYEHNGLGKSTGYDYTRLQNPTKEVLEEVITRLEHGADTLAFSSGMAAISTLFELFHAGDHILTTDDLYGGTIRYFDHILRPKQITVESVDTTDIKKVKETVNAHTKAIFVETPTNPLMRVADLGALAKLAKQHQILLIVDNTFLTPYYQNPLLLGADIVVHSGTKYLSGHNDTLAGFLVVKDQGIADKLRFILKTVGTGIAPFDAWLTIRGLKTLAIRLQQAQKNAIEIAQFLENHPKVKRIYFVGDPKHPGYQINLRQSRGFGSMIGFEVDNKETVKQVLEGVNLIAFAESLGGVESLITYPITQTHADIDSSILASRGINARFLRLSVGIEHVNDLINDLKQALGD